MQLDKRLIEDARRLIIQLLNLFDDMLGIPRTLPSKEERYRARQLQKDNDKLNP
mgnify:FL=1